MDLEWFPFFWRDFDEATREYTNEETGAYFRLLYYQWQYGSIPADRERAGRITGERFNDATWKSLLKKFVPDVGMPPDRLVNQRMKTVRAEQEAKAERRITVNTENGLRGVAARAAKRAKASSESVPKSQTEPVIESLTGSVAIAVTHEQPELRTKKEEKKDIAGAPVSSGVRPSQLDSKTLRGSRRTRRAPEEFGISDAVKKWAIATLSRVKAYDVETWMRKELVKFKDYEFNTAKSDWDATFRNWLRRCLEVGNAPAGSAGRDTDEDKHRADVLKTAAVFGATRAPEESFEEFESRVTALNDRRLASLGGKK